MMVMPQPFTTVSPVLANYPFSEIADGVGYTRFYPCRSYGGGAYGYFLTTQVIEGSSGGGGADYGFTSADYVSFDLTPFKNPRSVAGVATFSGERAMGAGTMTVTATICKVSGVTETTIGAEQVSEADVDNSLFCLYFTIAETQFAAGDILRLKIKTSGGQISVDPTGTVPAATNPSKLTIPFKIDHNL